MISLRFSAALCLTAVFAAGARADDRNCWPGPVTRVDPVDSTSWWSAGGPFLFDEPEGDDGRVGGFRPFYVRWTAPSGVLTEVVSLYPLFYYRSYDDTYEWSFFKLITRYSHKGGGHPAKDEDPHTFDVWPFYYSRDTGNSATSDHAFFPIYGRIRERFALNDFSWILFPLSAHSNNRGAATTWLPWPILHVTTGAIQGFGIWPLYGQESRPGYYHRQYFLWPLIWNNTTDPGPDDPPGSAPGRQVGFLPFYTLDRSPAVVSENFFWPFFGYSNRVTPYRYHEVRYFWPFLVQGRGVDHYVNRWGPVYTHSVRKGMDETWAPWPLFHRRKWVDGDIAQTRTQLLYFLYWNQEQRKISNPAAVPAVKLHIWPLISLWDNGAGRRQFQVPSPLEVFFPDNKEVRRTWSPFFSLLRYDQRAPGNTRISLLWNAITWEKNSAVGRSTFHVGPVFSVERVPTARRIAFGNGLFGFTRGAGGSSWHPFVMEFSSLPDSVSTAVR